MKNALIVAATVLSFGCSSGSNAIRSEDQGFTIQESDASRFTARYESDRSLDQQEMTRNFLFHAAKAVIDRGGIYMRVDGMTTEASTVVGRRDTTQDPSIPPAAQPSPQDPQSSVTSPPGDATYGSAVTITREKLAEAQVRYWKEKPPGIVTLEASRVMEMAREGELPRF